LLHRNHWSIIEGDWALFQAYDRGCDCLAALEGVVDNGE
jgi:hypothetical protein